MNISRILLKQPVREGKEKGLASAVVPDREMLLVLERLLWEEEDAEDLGRDLAA